MRIPIKHLATIIFITATVIAGNVACKKEKKEAGSAEIKAIPVQIAVVQQRDIAEELSLSGTLKPQAQVQVVSEVSARLLRLVRNEGDAVSRGEIIAILDDTDARLSNDRAAAATAVAKANREHAVAERDRADHLLKTGGITDKDHLAATVNLQVSEASLQQAKAEQAIAAQQLARCTIRAPFAGRVAKRMADVGSMLSAGTPVVVLVDNSVMEFRASVPSTDLAKVRLGANAKITVDSMPGVEMQGSIARILPTVDERSRSFDVVIHVPGQQNLIAGLFGRARIKVREIPAAIVIPPAALVRDGTNANSASVFAVKDHKAESVRVEVGYEGVSEIEVKNGLTTGMVVVVDPPATLGSGAIVLGTKLSSELETAQHNVPK